MVVPLTRGLGFHQRIHEAQISEGIAAIDHLALIGRAAVTMHKSRGQGSPTKDHRNGNSSTVEGLEVVLHEGG